MADWHQIADERAAEIIRLTAENAELLETVKIATKMLERAAEDSSGMTLDDDELPPQKLAAKCLARYLAARRPKDAHALRSALALMIDICKHMSQDADNAVEIFHGIKTRLSRFQGGKP